MGSPRCDDALARSNRQECDVWVLKRLDPSQCCCILTPNLRTFPTAARECALHLDDADDALNAVLS